MSKNLFSEEYCISSGEFQKMCQTTRDTLRYYHNQGLLVPRRKEENGYYYYSHAQIGSYYFIKVFRDLGCSIDEIKSHLLSGNEAAFDSFYAVQQQNLLRQQEELQKKIDSLDRFRKILKTLRSIDGQGPTLVSLDAPYQLHVTPFLEDKVYSINDVSSYLRPHHETFQLSEYQTFPLGVCINWNDFLQNNYRYQSLFSFASDSVQVQTLPGTTLLATVHKDSDGPIENTYESIKKYIERNSLKVLSDVYSLSIVNVIDPLIRRKYLKYIFLCVRTPDQFLESLC